MLIGPRNPVSQQLHAAKYRQRGESFDDYCVRYARTTADDEKHFRRLLERLRDQAILPAGRQQRAVGWPFQTTAFNCFVGGTIADDTRAIGDSLTDAMLTLRSGGGCGWDFSTLRGEGEPIRRLGDDAYASGPVSFMGIWHAMCNTIRSAGERRGAMMGVLRVDHPDILTFIRAKQDQKSLTNFNISVGITSEFMEAVETDSLFWLRFPAITPLSPPGTESRKIRQVRALDLWSIIMENNWDWAEPGILFLDTINRMNPLGYCEWIAATNPCVVGETLIAVAGRGPVPIRTLAEEGKDIPVFAVDPSTGETVVRWGRSPRLTRRRAPLVKVTLDDGSTIRCTPNHRFPLRDGRKVEAQDLQPGNSLFRCDGIEQGEDWYVNGIRQQHLMAEAKYGRRFDFGTRRGQYHCHHVDGDHLNNDWNNIEVKTAEDHNRDHKLGDGNPMRFWWQGLNDDQRAEYRRRMSEATSGERNGMWGRIQSLDTRAKIGEKTVARHQSAEYREKHARAVKASMTAEARAKIAAAAKAKFKTFDKVCEHCEEPFQIRAKSLETGSGKKRFCSQRCAIVWRNEQGRGVPLSAEHRAKISLVSAGKPHSEEHNAKVAAALKGKAKSPEHRAALSAARRKGPSNHKVVSVEPDGYGDVYNLTVEEFHNYAVVTSQRATIGGKGRFSSVYIRNCGEQPLPPDGACLLLSHNLVKYLVPTYSRPQQGSIEKRYIYDHHPTTYPIPRLDTTRQGYEIDYSRLRHDVDLSVRACDNVFERTVYPLPAQGREALAKRRMGVGVTGVANALEVCGYRYGTAEYVEEQSKILETIRDTAYRTSIEMAKVKGSFPLFDAPKWLASGFGDTLPEDIRSDILRHGLRNGLLLSIAPTGTISLTADNVSSGIEPPPVIESTRTINMVDGPRQVELNDWAYEEFGIRCRTAMETSPAEHVAVLCAAQRYVDSAISKTINLRGVRPGAEPTGDEISFAQFRDVYRQAYQGGAKGCAAYNANGKRAGIIVDRKPAPSPTEGGSQVTSGALAGGGDTAMGETLCEIDPTTGARNCG